MSKLYFILLSLMVLISTVEPSPAADFFNGQVVGSKYGILRLIIVKDSTNKVTPARVELLNQKGDFFVPKEALTVNRECPSSPFPEWFPDCMLGYTNNNFIENPITGTRQFYLDKAIEIRLPEGEYTIKAYKGIEYSVAKHKFRIWHNKMGTLIVRLKRWINMSEEGWYSSDDHIHLTRMNNEDNKNINHIMQAEDINIANLIQMGNEKYFDATKQYAFGEAGVYREDDTLLISGQEHPRTHFLGHTITLGGEHSIDTRNNYIDYLKFVDEAKKIHALTGFAHWGLGPAQNGLAITLQRESLSLLEVFQMEFPHYDIWYEILNMGIRLTPTAGTDFPCGPSTIPGRERFYTRIDGEPLSSESWLNGVRAGRTFVTNGPIIKFNIGSANIGDEYYLDSSSEITISAEVFFDPTRDNIKRVELIKNGRSIKLEAVKKSAEKLVFSHQERVDESAWFAIRAVGDKVGETNLTAQPYSDIEYKIASMVQDGVSMRQRERYTKNNKFRPSEAHTAPVYVTVKGKPHAIEERLKIVNRWILRLNNLEKQLSSDNINSIPILDFIPNSDGISRESLHKNQDKLLSDIKSAREFFNKLVAH